jgi:hypothetical protein
MKLRRMFDSFLGIALLWLVAVLLFAWTYNEMLKGWAL